MKTRIFSHSLRTGFTLIELLVATSVLTLIMLLVTQLVSGVQLSTSSGHRRMEMDSEARFVLDRISHDINRMLIRPDIDYGFNTQTGNDELSFFSEVPNSNSTSRELSLIGYRVNGNQLERTAEPTGENTNGSGIFGKSYNRSTAFGNVPSAPNLREPIAGMMHDLTDPATTHFMLLSSHIFRFEIGFIVPNNAGDGIQVINELSSQRISDIKGITVTFAMVDERAKTSSGTQLSAIADELNDTLTNEEYDYLREWQETINSMLDANQGSDGAVAISEPVRQSLRVYQRYYFFQ